MTSSLKLTATVFPMLAAGVAVVFTDYIGLGTLDRVHSYVNRVDEGHAVLDAARAAQQLAVIGVPRVDVPDDGPVGIYGYSQGGGASAAAVELQPSYASELKLKGAAVGARHRPTWLPLPRDPPTAAF